MIVFFRGLWAHSISKNNHSHSKRSLHIRLECWKLDIFGILIYPAIYYWYKELVTLLLLLIRIGQVTNLKSINTYLYIFTALSIRVSLIALWSMFIKNFLHLPNSPWRLTTYVCTVSKTESEDKSNNVRTGFNGAILCCCCFFHINKRNTDLSMDFFVNQTNFVLQLYIFF